VAAGGKPKMRRTLRGPARRLARDFYGSAVDEAERIALEEARELEGLDEEIAVLRMRLRKALDEHREDYALMLRGADLLVKAVVARYRLSKDAEEDLSDSIAGVVRGVGGLLMPEAGSE
jgi:hypothetical protein